ncbi:MAG: hypothetical protein IPF66_24580 [Holophagales bacterium]|nr:hypothetical protein [Holophagales bacterium]
MSRADVEFANIYVATNPANAALLARGAKEGLAAAGRAADRFLAKMPVHLEPGVETPSAFGARELRGELLDCGSRDHAKRHTAG